MALFFSIYFSFSLFLLRTIFVQIYTISQSTPHSPQIVWNPYSCLSGQHFHLIPPSFYFQCFDPHHVLFPFSAPQSQSSPHSSPQGYSANSASVPSNLCHPFLECLFGDWLTAPADTLFSLRFSRKSFLCEIKRCKYVRGLWMKKDQEKNALPLISFYLLILLFPPSYSTSFYSWTFPRRTAEPSRQTPPK